MIDTQITHFTIVTRVTLAHTLQAPLTGNRCDAALCRRRSTHERGGPEPKWLLLQTDGLAVCQLLATPAGVRGVRRLLPDLRRGATRTLTSNVLLPPRRQVARAGRGHRTCRTVRCSYPTASHSGQPARFPVLAVVHDHHRSSPSIASGGGSRVTAPRRRRAIGPASGTGGDLRTGPGRPLHAGAASIDARVPGSPDGSGMVAIRTVLLVVLALLRPLHRPPVAAPSPAAIGLGGVR